MPTLRLLRLIALLALSSACTHAAGAPKALQPFGSEQALDDLRDAALAIERERAERARRTAAEARQKFEEANPGKTYRPSVPIIEPVRWYVTDPAEPAASATQTSVDAPGTVKRRGDHFVILRQTGLYTVGIGNGALRPIDRVDGLGPYTPHLVRAYEGVLVAGDTVVVIGGLRDEIGLFDVTPAGELKWRSTGLLRLGGAGLGVQTVRLVGKRLVIYTAVPVQRARDLHGYLPRLGRWRALEARPDGFEPVVPVSRLYRAASATALNGLSGWHSVLTCEVDRPQLQCEGIAVLAGEPQAYHMGQSAVFVRAAPAVLMRLPYDGSPPTAVAMTRPVAGPHAWRESADGGVSVLLTPNPERRRGPTSSPDEMQPALLQLPAAAFSDEAPAPPTRHYRALPATAGRLVRGHFTRDWLAYIELRQSGSRTLRALRFAEEGPVHELELPPDQSRLEPFGADLLAVGRVDRDLHLTAVTLDDRPRVTGEIRIEVARHYSGDPPPYVLPGLRGGAVVGVVPPAQQPGATPSLRYLQQRAPGFVDLGTLRSHPEAPTPPARCVYQCASVYQDAHAFNVGDRLFTLLGYELVEAKIVGDRIVETQRKTLDPL